MEDELKAAVTLGDHSILGEDDGAGPSARPGDLDEEQPDHQRVDKDSDEGLQRLLVKKYYLNLTPKCGDLKTWMMMTS